MKTILLFLLVFSGSPSIDASPEVSKTSKCLMYGQNSSMLQQIRQITGINTTEDLVTHINKNAGTNNNMLASYVAIVIDNFNINELPSVVEYEVVIQCLAL